MSRSQIRDSVRAAGIGLLYFAAGKLGLGLAFVNASATAVWPPTGIALAAFLVYGSRLWPVVLVAAFLVNLSTAGSIATSIAIAAGNTLEGLLGTYLVRRFAGGLRVFQQPQEIFKFAVLAGMVATSVSASVGVTALALDGFVSWAEYGRVWLTWWLGDAAGALVVAPFLVLWIQRPRFAWNIGRVAEAAALLVTLTLVGLIVFGGASPTEAKDYPLEFLCFPVLVWVVFRFTQREAATATLVLSAIAIAGTLAGVGPFARGNPNESLLLLQAYMAVVSILVLAAAAALAERRRAEARIRSLNEQLEQRVLRRTEQLRQAVDGLRKEIAARAHAQEALERSEARLREAQQVARLGSWEWDIREDVVWWSDELGAIYGQSKDKYPTSYQAFVEQVHPEDRPYVRRVIEAAYQNKQPFNFEHRVIRADGAVLSIHARGQVLSDEEGRPIRMLGTGQDITDEKRAEEERSHLLREKRARLQAEEANRLKDDFLATLSHELRTPLNAIVGWANLLREGSLDSITTARAVETISRNAQIQSRLISDILDISRMIAGQLDFKLQMVNLTLVIESALDTMKPAAQASGIVLEANLDHTMRPALGSPDRLQQVVWNLLSNAIKFTPKGGQVWISLLREGTAAEIRVEDNGIGIDPDFLPHVFERFRQNNPSTARKHGGLGLGLAIARHIVEFHGGTISAANRVEGRGAVFTVTLPLTDSSGISTPQVRWTSASPAEPDRPSTPAVRPLHGIRALLVEDEPDSRELLATLLTGCGAQVEVASTAAEAMALLRSRKPDLLISDIAMPGETGYDLIERIRALPPEEGASIPAIAVTAYTSAEDARKALRAGYHAHLSKPVQLREIVRLVAELVDRREPEGLPQHGS